MLMCIKHIRKVYVGWGNLTDFQLCIENFQFSMQWYDFHGMNVVSFDDKFLWWILMFGYLQLRKWDPGINSPEVVYKGILTEGGGMQAMGP